MYLAIGHIAIEYLATWLMQIDIRMYIIVNIKNKLVMTPSLYYPHLAVFATELELEV